MEEAQAEFDALISDVPRRVSVSIPRERHRRGIEHAELAKIYDKMRLAYQRDGRPDEADVFRRLSVKHDAANQRSVRAQFARGRGR